MPAIDRHDTAGHERPGIRNQEQQRSIKFVELSEASLWHPLDERFSMFALEELIIQLSCEISGCQRIDADAVTRPLERERLGHLDDAGFRDRVRRDRTSHPQAEDR